VCNINNRWNETGWNTTNASSTTPLSSPSSTTLVAPLPDEGEVEKEHHYSMTIFFILLVLGTLSYLHLFLHTYTYYFLPPVGVHSIAVGMFVCMCMYVCLLTYLKNHMLKLRAMLNVYSD